MIEVGEVRKIVHTHPFERLAVFETVAYRFEIGTVSPDLFVAIHADRRRRHPRGIRSLNRRVAIATIDAVIAHVVLVTELDWLLALDVRAGVPAGSINFRS